MELRRGRRLYLSDILSRLTTQQEMEELLKSVRNGTIIHWAHVNFHGEYDFTKTFDFTKPRFDLEKILNLKLDIAA